MQLFILGIDFLAFVAVLSDQRFRKRLPIRQGELFTLCTLSQLYVILINNISMFFNRRYLQYPVEVLDGFNALFYIGYILRAYIFFLYTLEILGLKEKQKKQLVIFGAVVMLLEVALIIGDIFSDWFFFVDDSGYHTGKHLIYLYSGGLIFIFINYIYFWIRRVSFTILQKVFLFLYLTAQLIGSAARFFEARGGGISMAGICAIALIYIAFENPDIYSIGKGRFYNEEALHRVVNEWAASGEFQIFSFSISRYLENMEMYGFHQMKEAILSIGDFLKEELPDMYVFNAENRFALLSRKEMDYEALSQKIAGRFQAPWRTHASLIYFTPVFAAFDSGLWENAGEESVQALHLILRKREHAGEGAARRVLIAPEEINELKREIYIRRLVEHASDQGLVRMFLQPIADAKTGEICGAEALMRLCDTDESYISPAEFIPLAEKNGKIQELGRIIYTEVCRFYKAHEDQGQLQWVNVNLSPVQCLVPSLPEELREIAAGIGINTEKVHLEITEEAFIDIPKLLSVMEKLRKYGYAFALDDYGSGYSNISRIKTLPFANVKLDKSIVWNHFKESDELLPLTVRSLKSLHYTITAEGVESREMAEELSAMGVDYLQGYYFGKPVPEKEFTETYL